MIFINDEAEKFGGIQLIFCPMEKNGHFTFYGGKYINLVKYNIRPEKYCIIVSSAAFILEQLPVVLGQE